MPTVIIVIALLVAGFILFVGTDDKLPNILGLLLLFSAVIVFVVAAVQKHKQQALIKYTIILYDSKGEQPVVFLHTKSQGNGYELDDGRFLIPLGIFKAVKE